MENDHEKTVDDLAHELYQIPYEQFNRKQRRHYSAVIRSVRTRR